MNEPSLRYLSLGAGVQSTTLYLLCVEGLIDNPPTVAIFADTQCEPPWVYEQLEYLRAKHGHVLPIETTTVGNVMDVLNDNEAGRRFVTVPFFLRTPSGRGLARRQCTREYKVDPILRWARDRIGCKKGERMGARWLEVLVGISRDEAHRMKDAPNKWERKRYPLIWERPMTRQRCLDWLHEHGHPTPRRSACIICPYHRNDFWRQLRDHAPEHWSSAVTFDHRLRVRKLRGMHADAYLHEDLIPLDQVDLDKPSPQMELFGNECEGMCGT